MAMTEFGVGSALAVHRWSTSLGVEAAKKQYFAKFMGVGDDAMIKITKDLNKKAGDKVTVGLRMKLSGDGVEGDSTIEGTSAEESLTFFHDSLFIDQRRKGTKSKGKMSEQRVPYNIRKQGRDALATWWAEDYDEQIMMYLAGARGIDPSFHVDTGWTGRAGNPLQAPDSDHLVYMGNASAKNDVDASDTINLALIERLVAKIETLDPMILPFTINGEKKYVMLMHSWQAYDLRTSASTNDWVDIHKNTDGQKSLLYQNALGEYAGIIMHKHRNVIRFNDYGAGSNVSAGRALLLGAQAGMIAWGQGGSPQRYSWNEETDDRGNALVITAGTIYGVKKSRYNSKDIGILACDGACADPT